MLESMQDGAEADGADPDLAFAVEPCDVPWYGAQPPISGRYAHNGAAQVDLRLGAVGHRGTAAQMEGELRCGQARLRVAGRALRLIAWLATHQERINQCAAESGQLWLTWKGEGPQSISGDIRTRL
ncbi:MAG TPA: hypothetical protein VMV29_11880 [Ktedonobacterales bacterium]|nr:hypothetical protein [Ktedonobacterales bacterium]